MKVSLREQLRNLAERAAETEELYYILSAKCEAVERLLAAHHGSEEVTEEQIRLCVTCSELLNA